MIFPDLKANEVNPGTAFILLAWAELFGEKTSDTYRAKLHDTLSLVIEFGEVAKQAATEQRWMSHLPHVLEELQSEAATDPVLIRHYPHLKDAIAAVDKGIARSRAARLADTIQYEMHDYNKMVSDNFLQSLNGLPQRKENTLDALRRVATRAVQRGLTPSECRECIEGSAFTLEPATVGEQLLSRLGRGPQRWFCIVAITGNGGEIATLLHGTRFSQLPNRRKPLGRVGTEFLEQAGSAWLAWTEIEAAGRSEALQATLQPLRLVLDVANFSHRSAPFRLLPLVYMEADGRQHLIRMDAQSNTGLEPQRDATELAARMQREGVLERLPERIVTALEQHSVAHASTDPKVRFVNMWVALETLVGQDHESNIVDNLIRSILPHVVHRRVNKIIKYLAICLHEYGFCQSVPDDTGWFRHSTRHRVQSDELLLALTGAAGAVVHDRLAELTVDHPLLCNRLFTVHESVKDPKLLSKKLKESAKRTEWQLRRIYRARNILVHAGSPVMSLSYLATNLEYYFSLTLARVLHDFSRYPQWSLERSFEHRRIQYEHLLRQLDQNGDEGITVKHFLQQETGVLGQEQLWPFRKSA